MGLPSRSLAADAHHCIMVQVHTGPTEYKCVARCPRPMASSPRMISVTAKPVDMWTIGVADRLRSPRFPSKLEKRGNARLRPHTHRHTANQGNRYQWNIRRGSACGPKGSVKPLDTKGPIQACPWLEQGGNRWSLGHWIPASAGMTDDLLIIRDSFWGRLSSQPEAAGDDAAQDLAGAAAQGPGGRVQYGFGQHLLEPVARRAAAARRQEARELGDLALEGVAEILDQCGFEIGGLARLKHAGDRQRHPPQGPQVRGHPPDSLGDGRSSTSSCRR